MQLTSGGARPSTLAIGVGQVSVDHISATGMEKLRYLVDTALWAERNVPDTGEIQLESGRASYRLVPEGVNGAATLKNIVEGKDQSFVVLTAADPDRPITIADDSGPGDDGATGILVCGGDFTLRGADVFACKYIAATQRWVEVGRIWASKPMTDLEYPPLSRSRLQEISSRRTRLLNFVTLLAVEDEVTF